MSQRSGDFERALARLRSAYRAQLPARLDELAAELSRARESGRREAAQEARRHAHTLKGTSGSYGMTALSQALQALEARLDTLLAGEPAPPSAWLEIEAAMARARAALD